jgi:hypothetical protein
MKEAQPQETWTLWGSGLIVQAGTFIEYESFHTVRVARVERVRVIPGTPPYSDTQVISVKRYGPLRRHDGRRDDKVLPEKVIRVLDGPPPPAPKALTSLWSPRDSENPFRVEQSTLSNEAWRGIARWYPFSVRVLNVQGSGEANWQEQARTFSWNEAKEAMQTLAQLRSEQSTCWVVMKCELRGKEGREKPVMWYPGQSVVEQAIREKKAANMNV